MNIFDGWHDTSLRMNIKNLTCKSSTNIFEVFVGDNVVFVLLFVVINVAELITEDVDNAGGNARTLVTYLTEGMTVVVVDRDAELVTYLTEGIALAVVDRDAERFAGNG